MTKHTILIVLAWTTVGAVLVGCGGSTGGDATTLGGNASNPFATGGSAGNQTQSTSPSNGGATFPPVTGGTSALAVGGWSFGIWTGGASGLGNVGGSSGAAAGSGSSSAVPSGGSSGSVGTGGADRALPPACGDGKVNQDTEMCDDGNTLAGDGCSSTTINVYDVTQRESPKLVRQTGLSGSLMAARRIGNAIHTVVADGDTQQPDYATWPSDLETCGVKEATVKQRLARLAADNERDS